MQWQLLDNRGDHCVGFDDIDHPRHVGSIARADVAVLYVCFDAWQVA